jgi:murein DD-endopeptidase MepM/ murein hydrolase activator NlpD
VNRTWVGLIAVAWGCGPADSSREGALVCGPYPDWTRSAYVLPYLPGEGYRVSQGNCAGGHATLVEGAFRHGYDFAMPIGTTVVAARAGRVGYTRTRFRDGNGGGAVGSDNVVLIDHLDGTYGLYGHLTHDGALVRVGQEVAQGQPIALSGDTGMTGGLPHLHFMVSSCPGGVIPCGPDRSSIPVTFRNTRDNPQGLQTGETYTALAEAE